MTLPDPAPNPNPTYTIIITQTCERMLKIIKKQRGRQTLDQLQALILDLRTEPEKKTQALTGMLKGFRSLHAGRFRVVVRVEQQVLRVYVVGAGWHASGERDDVYQILARMVERGTIEP